jgi:hypothetical protein
MVTKREIGAPCLRRRVPSSRTLTPKARRAESTFGDHQQPSRKCSNATYPAFGGVRGRRDEPGPSRR